MNKTFKKTYVAVGAALTLFAALSLTLMPSIALALTASAPLTAADGSIGITINAGSTCAETTDRLYWNGSAISCETTGTGSGSGTVTSVSAFADGGLEVTGTASTAPVVGIKACTGTVGTKMLTNKHGTDATWQCSDVPVPLEIGTNSDEAMAGNTPIPTVIPAVITFRTNTSVSAPSSGTKVLYASLSGDLSSTEATVHTPLPAGTYANITCRASSAAGSGNTVKLFSGICGSGSAFSSGNVTVNLPTTGTDTAAGTGSITVDTTNKCAVVKISVGTSYAGEFINCSVEKTS